MPVSAEFERSVRARLDDHAGLDRPEREVVPAWQAGDDPGRPLGGLPLASWSLPASDTSAGRDSVVDKTHRAHPPAPDVLAGAGHRSTPTHLATISPCITHTIRRFAGWVLDLPPLDAIPAMTST
ncbi:hypothetical protein [Amycolatopsis sp. FDAARGOS 1241]|uniref:hypothetical protein n=1 Tax=Amycolatopsis sp. FDAARGOS 1241 TaxID=2778070 RepID=UPI00194EBDA2|nr:hypothetical protein [Amycolatopsis sp. FDAARGOS 1241]QRP42772.1 hypothetical protein I6J71_25175 [Amycolatopsis sp. FDAARGOS 1241]